MAPSVSLRTYFTPPGPDSVPAEPTTTLVLSTAQSRFVDLRFALDLAATSPSSSPPPLDLSTPAADLAARKPPRDPRGLARLDWAFSGRASRQQRPQGGVHARWAHEIDTTTPDAASVVDEGVCYPASTVVSDGRTVEWEREVGLGDAPYEEGWLDVPLPARAGVVHLAGEGKGGRGCVVRVGGYVQGLLRRGDGSVAAERWMSGGAGWELVARCESGDVGARIGACGVAMALGRPGEGGKAERLHVGDEFEDGRLRWKVEEFDAEDEDAGRDV